MAETNSIEASLRAFGERASKTRSLRTGSIVFHLGGALGGSYVLDCSPGHADVSEVIPGDRPLFEVIGDAETVRELLDGKTDARDLFLSGAFRIRGDLRYVSDLALEMGLLREAL
jgi:hypothetical protein